MSHLRTGIFLAPFHPLDEDPTEAIHRDLAPVEHLDALGFNEAWIGEHHSAGFEIIASPELFIAAAAERTKRIRLGTGVVSLPYHHPLMVANRIIQLDHSVNDLMGAAMNAAQQMFMKHAEEEAAKAPAALPPRKAGGRS